MKDENQMYPDMFEGYIKSLGENGEPTDWQGFQRQLRQNKLKFERLPEAVLVNNGRVRMTGRITCMITGRKMYLRDYWVDRAPKEPKSQEETR